MDVAAEAHIFRCFIGRFVDGIALEQKSKKLVRKIHFLNLNDLLIPEVDIIWKHYSIIIEKEFSKIYEKTLNIDYLMQSENDTKA